MESRKHSSLYRLIDEEDRKVIDGMYYLSEAQARGILDLRLHRLTGLEREKIQNDLAEIAEEIKGYLEILSSYEKLMEIITEELKEVKHHLQLLEKHKLKKFMMNFQKKILFKKKK